MLLQVPDDDGFSGFVGRRDDDVLLMLVVAHVLAVVRLLQQDRLASTGVVHSRDHVGQGCRDAVGPVGDDDLDGAVVVRKTDGL